MPHASSSARSHTLPAFPIREVSISQPDKHRLCLHLLQYTLGFGLVKLQGLREDPVSFLPSLMLCNCNLLTSCSSFVQLLHRPSPGALLLRARNPSCRPQPRWEATGIPAAPDLQGCILPLQLRLSSGLCCTRVAGPVGVGEPSLSMGTHHPQFLAPFRVASHVSCCTSWLVETMTGRYSRERAEEEGNLCSSPPQPERSRACIPRASRLSASSWK